MILFHFDDFICKSNNVIDNLYSFFKITCFDFIYFFFSLDTYRISPFLLLEFIVDIFFCIAKQGIYHVYFFYLMKKEVLILILDFNKL